MINEYTFEQISINQSVEFSQEITSEIVDKFAQLTGDINPRDIGLKFGGQDGYVDPTLRGAEHEGDGIDRARSTTGPMAYTVSGIDEFGLAVNQPQDIRLFLRACFDALAAADAQRSVNDGMEGNRLAKARPLGLDMGIPAFDGNGATPCDLPGPSEQQRNEIDDPPGTH